MMDTLLTEDLRYRNNILAFLRFLEVTQELLEKGKAIFELCFAACWSDCIRNSWQSVYLTYAITDVPVRTRWIMFSQVASEVGSQIKRRHRTPAPSARPMSMRK